MFPDKKVLKSQHITTRQLLTRPQPMGEIPKDCLLQGLKDPGEMKKLETYSTIVAPRSCGAASLFETPGTQLKSLKIRLSRFVQDQEEHILI